MLDHIVKAGAGALLGLVIGWTGSTLTTIGRVDAIEKTLQRIESRIDAIADSKGIK